MSQQAAKLLLQASDAGIHVTGLDGWTQTRLAKTLQIRRETLNAIINRAPGSEPTTERPRMVEACHKLITFAAALSAKDDAILKLPVDVKNLQSDDGQAYEHHRLRLHRLVEDAATDLQYTDAMCRLGEFASSALNAAKPFRLRMICNLVTAIQRLLDKPASRDVSVAVLRANLSRLYRAERAARLIGRERRDEADVVEQSQYVRGQAGYGLVCLGMILAEPRLVRRGGDRLFQAVESQPDPSYGHWCNLFRAVNDLMAVEPKIGAEWANRVRLLGIKHQANFAKAYGSLESRNEIQRLRAHWGKSTEASSGKRRAMALLMTTLLMITTMSASVVLAGDGRDFEQPLPTTGAPVDPGHKAAKVIVVRRPVELGLRTRRQRENDSAEMMTSNDPTETAPSDLEIVRIVKEMSPDRRAVPEHPRPEPAVTLRAPKQPISDDPAIRAAKELAMAKNYSANGNDEVARWKLKQIVKNYHDTPAAQEAQTLLAP